MFIKKLSEINELLMATLSNKEARYSKIVAGFDFLKHGRKIYIVFIFKAKTGTLLHITNKMMVPDIILHTDSYQAHKALDLSDFHHSRIKN